MVYTKAPKITTPARKERRVIPLSIVGAIVIAVAGGLFWFFGGEAPAEVDLAATASSVAEDNDPGSASSATEKASTDAGSTNDASNEAVSTGVEGTWNVDTSQGEFTVEDTTTATFVGFRVEEVLNSIGSTTAVGRTPDVSGSITIEETTLMTAEITADLISIISDESRREDPIQEALNTSSNPNATFVLTEPVDLGAAAADGEAVSVVATGELTINGVTNEVEVDLDAQLIDGMILVTGTTDIVLADYDVIAPTAPVVLSVDDSGTVEIQLWLSK
jgi:polyisoprenoid-binding protein YceI